MASTNKTTNYELSQFEGTDKPSWEADYNADMLSIDTNLKAVSNVADAASGDITTLDGRMTTAEGNITTNANDIDALEARADALEAGQTSDDGRLDALEAEQIVQNTAIESNTRLGYNLARPYDSASTYAVGAYVLFQDTLYKCTTAISTGESFDPSKWLAIKATDEIAAGGYTLPIASANDLGGIKVGSGLSIDAVTGVLSASGGSSANISSLQGSDITYTLGTLSGCTANSSGSAGGGQFIISIGNLRILIINLTLTNFSVTDNAVNYISAEIGTTFNNIDAPSTSSAIYPCIKGYATILDNATTDFSKLQFNDATLYSNPSKIRIQLNKLTSYTTSAQNIVFHLAFAYLV